MLRSFFQSLFKRKTLTNKVENVELPVETMLSFEEKEQTRKNEFIVSFLTPDLIGFEDIEKNMLHLNEKKDKNYSRIIAISEDENKKVVMSVGVLNHLEKDELGYIVPVLFDMVSGKLVRNIKKLIGFNVEAMEMLCKLNKGQFLSLFKMAHIEIDEEMKVETELSLPIYHQGDLEKLKHIGFCSDEEKKEKMCFIVHYWNHAYLFQYDTKMLKSKPEKENTSSTGLKQSTLVDMLKNKRLVLPLTNENDEPTLSVVFGVHQTQTQQFPRLHELVSEKENSFFGLPHYFSNTLLSCFEKLTKQDLNALYYGIRKENKDQGNSYTTYDVFFENIQKGLKKYENYSEETVEKHGF